MKLRIFKLLIKTDKPLYAHAASLRGFIGRQFQYLELLHNHSFDNSLMYIYPRIQYQILDEHALILGIEEGVDTVKLIESMLLQLSLKGVVYNIIEKTGTENYFEFGVINSQTPYSFITPWLALNEKNYEKYRKFGNWNKKKEMLEKILIGNIISMSKSLGYTVPEPIIANIGKLKEVNASLKGNPMIGFLGDFSVNFEIPDYWGIGKSVSRGFGTIKRVNELKSLGVKELGDGEN